MSNLEDNHFIYYSQDLLFHLLKNNISFPISVISNLFPSNDEIKSRSKHLYLERYLYEELDKKNKLSLLEKKKEYSIEIREKTRIEEVIEKDDIDRFRLLSNETTFNFNGNIKKVNELYQYSEIPIILYCIEKNSMKCFKYALINGADPSQKSMYYGKKIWDGYGFSGAIGNIQILKMIEDQGIEINENLMKGSSKFHQNHIIKWIEKQNNSLLQYGVKECIQFENFDGFDTINQNYDIASLKFQKNKSALHYAAKYNSKEIGEILISKGSDINAEDLIDYTIVQLFFNKMILNL